MRFEFVKLHLLQLVFADTSLLIVQRKNNVWIVTSLIKFGLIPLEEYDIQLAKQLNKENPDAQFIEFTTELLQNCLLTMHPITTLEDHVLAIHALQKLQTPKYDMERSVDRISILTHIYDLCRAEELLQDLRNRMDELYKNRNALGDSFSLRLLLAEWTRVCRHNMANDTLYTQFAERVCLTAKKKNIKFLALTHLFPKIDSSNFNK